ncbi:MAG: TonB-linked SusC/RagA family outer membrane protein [Flavobacteriaceae bacterium]
MPLAIFFAYFKAGFYPFFRFAAGNPIMPLSFFLFLRSLITKYYMKILFTSLIVAFAICTSWAQELTLQGKVLDSDNQPVPSASVKLSGSDASTTTNADGTFKIPVADGYETVVISAPGLKTQKIFLAGKTYLDVSMKKGKKSDDESSSGFGTQSKSEMTSSVSSISTDNVSPSPLINLEQSNQGKTTGMFVQNSSGKLGEGTTVRIRGGSSLSASNQPLYVIDGVPLTSGNQSNINPSNIANIEILKDASAGAMYGARAANGVILITTKSGGSGKMKIDADYQYGISQTPRKLDLITPQQYNEQVIEFTLRSLSLDQHITKERLQGWAAQTGPDRDIIVLPGTAGTVGMPNFYDSLIYNTDWQDEVFRTAASHRANLSLQGGTEALGYFASVSYTGQEGILIGNKYDRINGSLSLDSKISEKLSAQLNVNYFYSKDFRLKEDQDLGAPLQAIVLPPSDSYNAANNYQLIVRSLEYNPLTEINFSDNLAFNNSVVANLGLKYDITDALSLELNGGADYNASRQEIRQGPETRDGSLTGRSQYGEQNIQNYIFNGWFNYEPELSGENSLTAMLGVSYQESQALSDYRVANINSVSDLQNLPESNPLLNVVDIPGQASRFVSSFGRVNYSIMDKYLFQFSGRMDGSSKFGNEYRYGFFPAVSTGWNVTNESFMSGITPISFLKLKASYGLVGNTPDDDFLYRSNYFNVRYGAAEGLRLANLSNPALKWETTAQLNVGLDFGFFEDRISGSVEYYNKTTTDLLFPVPVSQTSGFASVLKNVGSMENKGLEINLSTINFENDDFSWSTDFNISFNKNTVTDLGGADLIVGVNAFRENESAGVFYMRKYMGVSQLTGEALYDNGVGGTTTDWESAPRQIVGDPNPDYYGGLTNSLRYKDFELSAMFQFVGGADLYFETGEFLANSGILNLGQLSTQYDRWYAPGDVSDYPALDPFQENTFPSTRWLQDGSYIRLKTITLSYNLPAITVSNWGMEYVSVYIGATNLITITDYTGYDPDVSYFDPLDGVIGQNISRGIDNFTAPQPRIFMTGIKIGL